MVWTPAWSSIPCSEVELPSAKSFCSRVTSSLQEQLQVGRVPGCRRALDLHGGSRWGLAGHETLTISAPRTAPFGLSIHMELCSPGQLPKPSPLSPPGIFITTTHLFDLLTAFLLNSSQSDTQRELCLLINKSKPRFARKRASRLPLCFLPSQGPSAKGTQQPFLGVQSRTACASGALSYLENLWLSCGANSRGLTPREVGGASLLIV